MAKASAEKPEAARRGDRAARLERVDRLLGGPCGAAELAELLGVSERTVFRYVEDRVFPPRAAGGWSPALCLELYGDLLVARTMFGGAKPSLLEEELGIEERAAVRAWRRFGPRLIGLEGFAEPWRID